MTASCEPTTFSQKASELRHQSSDVQDTEGHESNDRNRTSPESGHGVRTPLILSAAVDAPATADAKALSSSAVGRE
jgi:hypothetical protein